MAVQGPIPVEFATCSRTGRSRPGPSSRCGTSTLPAAAGSCRRRTRQTALAGVVVEVIDADPAARDKTAKVKVAAAINQCCPRPRRGCRSCRWSSPG